MTDSQDLFTNLPIDVVLQIVKQINAHTLRSLLLACKRLRKYSIHLINYRPSPSFFGGIPGIKSVSVVYTWDLILSDFKGWPIKLVELEEAGLYARMDKKLLRSPLCFVHALGGSDMAAHTTLLVDPQRRCLQSRRLLHDKLVHGVSDEFDSSYYVHTHLDKPSRGYFFEFPHFYYPLQLYTQKVWYRRYLRNWPGLVFNKVPHSDRIVSSKLRLLTITATSLVENICLPLLKRLSVEFYRTNDDTVPQIRNIHAPYLLVFRVHFSGRMPTFSQINVCSFQCSSKRTFELVNTNATSPTSFMEDSTTDYADYQNMDFNFFSHLDAVSLIGVPDFVFNAANWRHQLRELHWHHSVAYTHPSMPVRTEKWTLRNLRSLIITSAAPNFTPPDFDTPQVRFLVVCLTGFNPSLGDLIFNAAKPGYLCLLHVVSIPSDKRLIGHPQAHITLKLKDMSAIQVLVNDLQRGPGNLQREPEVIFQGCFFGKDNRLLGMGLHRFFAGMTRPPRLQEDFRNIKRMVKLVCVKPLGDTGDTLNIQFLKHTNLPLRSLVVEQLFNEEDKPWRKLRFVIPSTTPEVIVDDRGFEEVDARVRIVRRIPRHVFRH